MMRIELPLAVEVRRLDDCSLLSYCLCFWIIIILFYRFACLSTCPIFHTPTFHTQHLVNPLIGPKINTLEVIGVHTSYSVNLLYSSSLRDFRVKSCWILDHKILPSVVYPLWRHHHPQVLIEGLITCYHCETKSYVC